MNTNEGVWSSGMIRASGNTRRFRDCTRSRVRFPLHPVLPYSFFWNQYGLVIAMNKFQLHQITTGTVTAFFKNHGFRGLSRCMTTPVATSAQDTEPASR